jgi:hypothetical protein
MAEVVICMFLMLGLGGIAGWTAYEWVEERREDREWWASELKGKVSDSDQDWLDSSMKITLWCGYCYEYEWFTVSVTEKRAQCQKCKHSQSEPYQKWAPG